MKKIVKYVVVLAAGVMATACSEDYLNTKPSYGLSDGDLQEDVENYAAVINGISQLMITQQGNYGQGYCGMSTLQIRMGDMCGNDLSMEGLGGYNSCNLALCDANNAAWSGYCWWFLYNIIGNANRVIGNIDQAEGSEESAAYYKAQALTYRAYAYTYLVQLFSKRWIDSNNGATPGVVLRLEPTTDGMGLSTLAECLTQIYKDCDDAIALFEESGRSTSEYYLPSVNMAWGVKARAALVRQDWETAATAAHNARAGYPLMSQAEFADGFCEHNDEWIYGGTGLSEENMWYYTFGAYHAYNGYFSFGSAVSTIASRELVDQFPDSDVRKSLFFHQGLFSIPFTYSTDNTGSLMSQARANIQTQAGLALRNQMLNYMLSLNGPSARYEQTGYYPYYPAAYGHLKFAVFDTPGVSEQCFMRAAEMYLTEAEALCKKASPDEAGARALLDELNAARDSEYAGTTATGQALIDEIMLTRRMELWGEGHAWFDLKRTGGSISRKSYFDQAADGTIADTFGINWAKTLGPNAAGTNDWVWTIPLSETQYNDMLE